MLPITLAALANPLACVVEKILQPVAVFNIDVSDDRYAGKLVEVCVKTAFAAEIIALYRFVTSAGAKPAALPYFEKIVLISPTRLVDDFRAVTADENAATAAAAAAAAVSLEYTLLTAATQEPPGCKLDKLADGNADAAKNGCAVVIKFNKAVASLELVSDDALATRVLNEL
jgi:hypothetical protein